LCKIARITPKEIIVRNFEEFLTPEITTSPKKGRASVCPPSPTVFSASKRIMADSSPGKVKQKSKNDDELKEREIQEVAKIRYEHYMIKRYRKLQILHELLEKRI